MMNIDFAHVRNVMRMGGGSLLAMGQGEGLNKAHEAINNALHHPLLESVNLYTAGGIIANFTGGPDLSFVRSNRCFELPAGNDRKPGRDHSRIYY